MAYRRRRRNRGTWLPTLGAPIGETTLRLSGFSGQLPVDPENLSTAVFVITADAPSYQDPTASDVMGDVIGNEYFLDRIVGKFSCQTIAGFDGSDDFFLFPTLVAAGFFVARSEETSPNTPIGLSEANYSPLANENIREPWIWRRTWILGNGGNTFFTDAGGSGGQVGNDVSGGFPNSNAYYGSVLDGPHIDAKTKRRVGQDDRLFFGVSVSYIPAFGSIPGASIQQFQAVNFYLDYRLHGALRRSRPGGKF